MSKRARAAVVTLVVLLAAGVALVATYQLVGFEGLLSSRLSETTGREFRFEGPLKLRPGLAPGLRVEDVTIGPAEGSALRSVHVRRLDLVFKLMPLLRGDFEVRWVELDGAHVVFEPAAADAETDAPAVPAKLDRLHSLARAKLRDLEIEIRWPGDGPATRIGIEALNLEDGEGAHPLTMSGNAAGARVSGSGSVDVSQGLEVELALEAEAPHLQAFSRVFGRELPEVGPVRLTAQLSVRGETLGVSDLDLRIGSRDASWLEMTGHVRDLASWRDFSLDAEFGFADVRTLKPLVRDPPHIGEIAGTAKLHDAAGPPRVEEFTLKGGRAGVFQIDVQGQLEDVSRVHGLDASVELEARDLAVLGELFRLTLPPVGPVEVSGKVTAQEGLVTDDYFRARIDRTQLEGSLVGRFEPERRPHFEARLSAGDLYLDDIGIQPRPDEEPRAAPANAAAGRLFSDTPLSLGWMRVVDGRLALNAGRVLGVGGRIMKGLELNAGIDDGRFSLDYAADYFEGGSNRGALALDSTASPPELVLTASARGLDLGRLVAQIDDDEAWSGQVDVKLDLRSRGASPSALAAGLDGEAVVSCGGGTIATEHAGLLMRDVMNSVRQVVGRRHTSVALNCMILDVAFSNGRGTSRALVVDAEDVLVVGEGSVDLRRETVDVRLVPRPRRSSPLSTAMTVQLSGPLARPVVRLEKGSLLTHTTEALFDNIWSLSGVRSAWRRLGPSRSTASPCGLAVASGTK